MKSCFSEPCTVFMEWWVFSLFQPKSHGTVKWDMVRWGQDITGEILDGFQRLLFFTIRYICSKISEVHIELYTDCKDLSVEQQLEAVLDRHGIFYEKTETWIESERLYEVLYYFEMEV